MDWFGKCHALVIVCPMQTIVKSILFVIVKESFNVTCKDHAWENSSDHTIAAFPEAQSEGSALVCIFVSCVTLLSVSAAMQFSAEQHKINCTTSATT